jgi:hypothetical protein
MPHTNTGYIDVPLFDTVLAPVLFAAVFPRFPLPFLAGRRNAGIAIIHELLCGQFVPGKMGVFRAFYGPFGLPVCVFPPLPSLLP